MLATAVIIVVLWVVRLVVLAAAFRTRADVRVRYTWRKTSLYITSAAGIILVAWVWIEAFDSIATFVGLVSAALTIALQAPIVNLAGWVFIISRRPFSVGDRVEVGGVRGDVIDQRIFMFTMLEIGNWVDADQSTGRVIHVPNGRVFDVHIANYTGGFSYIWNEIGVLVTFESNWRAAKEILLEVAERHDEQRSAEADQKVREASRKYMIFYRNLTPTVYTTVRDCGVLLTARYLSEPRRRRAAEEAIWEDILDAFAERGDIDLAYPTVRYYDHTAEGKPPMRAK